MVAGLLLALQVALTAQSAASYLPAPVVPADNPLSAAKIALGERLFHDPRLSATGQYSCASCHQPQRYFTDGLARAVGALGAQLPLNTPTLYYSAYNASLGWLDTGPETLEAQHRIPLFNRDPVEMGFGTAQLQQLTANPQDRAEFAAAFGVAFGASSEVDTDNLVKALASYIRSLSPPATPFDRYLFDDERDALSAAAKAGMALFFSPRLGCSECHASLSLSGPIRHQQQRAEPVFHVMGVSGSSAAFRAPTLRYVQFTAPYMHDGSMPSLDAVLRHYQQRPSPRVPAFALSATERDQLLAFLACL